MTVAEIERIGSPQISRDQARRAFLEYRRATGLEKDQARRAEYAALMRGYRAIARGQQVIDLHQTLQTAGVQEDTLYPRLAICRADARHCRVAMEQDGGATFCAIDDPVRDRWRRIAKARKVVLPRGTFPLYELRWNNANAYGRFRPGGTLPERNAWRSEALAVVPIVPAALHPRAALANYHILWDAVWTPAPPVDPLLVRHLSGALYAIVAQWDLTPLERAVLRGRL